MIDASKFKSVLQVLDFFKDETTCKNYLAQQRWSGKVCCPFCNNEKVYTTNRGYKCASPACYKKFTVTVGTPFENSKISLRFWFAAIYLISNHKKGISSHQIARDLGISQKSGWFLLHRVRQMYIQHAPEMITEMVQLDETYVGGKESNKHKSAFKRREKRLKQIRGRNKESKTPVFAMRFNGVVRAQKVADVKNATIHPIIENNIAKGTTIVTDSFGVYRTLENKGYNHVSVNHEIGQYVYNGFHTNGIENFFSHFKRTVYGTYHQISPKHMDKYIRESAYRYNTRKVTDRERFHMLLTNSNGNRLRYADLIAE